MLTLILLKWLSPYGFKNYGKAINVTIKATGDWGTVLVSCIQKFHPTILLSVKRNNQFLSRKYHILMK